MEEYLSLIQKIETTRKTSEIFQKELAHNINMDERTYRKKLTGESCFTIIEFLEICKTLNKKPSYFFEGMNPTIFNNCNNSGNSGNNHTYQINEVSRDTINFIVEAIKNSLDKS